MSQSPPRLVIFDIDGTLLATDAFWLEIGRSAVSKIYARHGIEHELPPAHLFLEAFGLPMPEFWQHALPQEHHHLADEVEAEAQELEELAFAEGLGAMYPGARKLLDDLHAAGRTLGLASNCGQRYLDGFVKAFGLEEVVAEPRCLDSPGVRSKADMIRDILDRTGVEPAVMIGDRDNDREAAVANRVPFILFSGGFGSTKTKGADTLVRSYAELREILLP